MNVLKIFMTRVEVCLVKDLGLGLDQRIFLLNRTEDTVVYGNQSGGVEVFYQQAVPPSAFAALPTPADLMGIVALKAKRRVERDHGIVLL